jgi:hypothetical protein
MNNRIKQSSARGLAPLRPFIPENTSYRIGLPIDEIDPNLLNRAGCPQPAKVGEAFLPRSVGPHTEHNINGREEVLKHGNKETVYRMVYRTWNDWHGNPHSGVASHPYERWPRFQHPPRYEHLNIVEMRDRLYLVSDTCRFNTKEQDRNLHVFNVLLESFGECEIIGNEGELLNAPKIRKNNWDLLPPGKYPWDRTKQVIEKITSQLRPDEREVIEYRMQRISKLGPDTLALGRGGFHGYFAFGFSKRNLFVLESIFLDNATYVFGSDWETISQLSKAEIISGGLQKDRIVHDRRWKFRLSRLAA